MNHIAWFAVLLALFMAERLLELRSANRNFHRLVERGGREFGAAHYPMIVGMHIAFFVSLVVEFLLRRAPLAPFWPVALGLLALAQFLRLWSRRAMGKRWTTRIVVVPGERLITHGLFRFVRHPIYVAVALELFSAPLLFGLFYTCIAFTIFNAGMLLLIRIPAERAALAWSQHTKSQAEMVSSYEWTL